MQHLYVDEDKQTREKRRITQRLSVNAVNFCSRWFLFWLLCLIRDGALSSACLVWRLMVILADKPMRVCKVWSIVYRCHVFFSMSYIVSLGFCRWRICSRIIVFGIDRTEHCSLVARQMLQWLLIFRESRIYRYRAVNVATVTNACMCNTCFNLTLR